MTEKLPPVISCTPTDGTWHATNVDIACTATDGASGVGSGLADPADAAFTLATIVADDTERADAQTTTRYICDALGNCTRAGWAGAFNSFSGYKIDRRAPQLFAPGDITVEATSEASLVTLGQATGRDFGSGLAEITNDADPAGFPVGATVVTWTATDNVGNATTSEQIVTVVDTTPPVLTVPPDVVVTARREGEAIGEATATDAVGVKFISNDAPNIFRRGRTTVTWYAMDAAGNISSARQFVSVKQNGGGVTGIGELLLLLVLIASRARRRRTLH
jgi:hypothetical protein